MKQQQNISWSDCDVQQKVDFIWQPAPTDSVAGPRRSSKALPKAKLAPKKGHGHCLVVCWFCCHSDPLGLPEFQQNHYIWEVCWTNQWDTPATPAASIGQQKGPIFLQKNIQPHVAQPVLQKLNKLGYRVCLICHIHLISCQLTTTFSSILTTFCKDNASTTSRMQKMLSKRSWNPKAWIFMLQE